jgi:hypothetical protein
MMTLFLVQRGEARSGNEKEKWSMDWVVQPDLN